MLDGRSLCQDDLIGADIVFPHYCDEGYELLHSPHHRWFYKQRMDTDEVIMFKLYDSSPEEVRCKCYCLVALAEYDLIGSTSSLSTFRIHRPFRAARHTTSC